MPTTEAPKTEKEVFIPKTYLVQEKLKEKSHDDGSITKTFKVSKPFAPNGETVTELYQTGTQEITYTNDVAIVCVKKDAKGTAYETKNLVILK